MWIHQEWWYKPPKANVIKASLVLLQLYDPNNHSLHWFMWIIYPYHSGLLHCHGECAFHTCPLQTQYPVDCPPFLAICQEFTPQLLLNVVNCSSDYKSEQCPTRTAVINKGSRKSFIITTQDKSLWTFFTTAINPMDIYHSCWPLFLRNLAVLVQDRGTPTNVILFRMSKERVCKNNVTSCLNQFKCYSGGELEINKLMHLVGNACN